MQKDKQIFPIDIVIPQLLNAFQQTGNIVLSAPPGAGKTTQVPISLLSSQ